MCAGLQEKGGSEEAPGPSLAGSAFKIKTNQAQHRTLAERNEKYQVTKLEMMLKNGKEEEQKILRLFCPSVPRH